MHGISKSDWVPIAHLLRPQGRRGELLAEPLSDLPGIFSTPCALRLTSSTTNDTPSTSDPIHIQEHWFPKGKNAGRIVLKLSGCDSISDAESLAGMQLVIATEHLPALDPDTFYVGDLIGCHVIDNNVCVGTVVGLEFPTGPDGRTRLEDAAPLLAVLSPAQAGRSPAEPVLIPFVRAWLDSIDIPAHRIHMHLPAGLLDPPPSSCEPS